MKEVAAALTFATLTRQVSEPAPASAQARATAAGRLRPPRYDGRMAEEQQQPLAQQLEEIGAQLDWVRDYL